MAVDKPSLDALLQEGELRCTLLLLWLVLYLPFLLLLLLLYFPYLLLSVHLFSLRLLFLLIPVLLYNAQVQNLIFLHNLLRVLEGLLRLSDF